MGWSCWLAYTLASALPFVEALKTPSQDSAVPHPPEDVRAGADNGYGFWKPPTEQQLNDVVIYGANVTALAARLAAHKTPEHLVLIGDSTVRNMNMIFSRILEARGIKHIHITQLASDLFAPNALNVLSKKKKNSKIIPPTVVAFGANFHMLHLEPHLPWNTIMRANFLNYTSLVKQTLDRYHQVMPSARLVPLLANALCEGRWNGDMKQTLDAVQANANGISDMCVQTLRQDPAFSQAEVQKDMAAQCSKSWFTNANVAYLNDQFRSAAEHWGKANPSASICVVDRFENTRGHCNDKPSGTADGVHWVQWGDRELFHLIDTLQW